jgi:hypothetical protein
MFETCRRCGYVGPVVNTRLHHAPILGFYNRGGRHRYDVDVWLCDVCASEVRDHGNSQADSFEATDQTESEKGNKHV